MQVPLGTPVDRAVVKLERIGEHGAGATAITDAQGAFRFADLTAGAYRISVSKSGYTTSRASSRIVTVPADGQAIPPAMLELVRLGVIYGTVQDDTGQPMTGVQVRASRLDYSRGLRRWSVTGPPTYVDEAGRFRMANLLPGRYLVTAELQRDAVATPSEAGRYGVTFHPAAVDARDAFSVRLGAGGETQANIEMRRRRSFRVAGRLVLPNPPQQGSGPPQTVLNLNLTAAGSDFSAPGSQFFCPVQEDGLFEFPNVPPGDYVAEPSHIGMEIRTPSGRTSIVTRAFGSMPVRVTDRDVTDLVLPLRAGLTIEGVVRFEDAAPSGESASAKEEWKGVVVQIQAERLAGPERLGRPDVRGVFQMNHVAPDLYRVLVTGLPPGAYLKAALLGRRDLADRTLDLRGGEVAGPLQIVLGRGAVTLQGVVRDEAGRAQADVLVTAIRKADRGRRDPEMMTARTDADGRFTISGLAPAEWDIAAWEDVEVKHLARAEVLAAFVSKFQTADLRTATAEPRVLDLRAIAAGEIASALERIQ